MKRHPALILTLTALVAPSALAATGISPLDKGIETVGRLFNIQVLQTNDFVRDGFLKLCLFVVLFAVSNAAFKRVGGIFDPKTAGIVSFAFSAIGALLMPRQWFDAQTNILVAVLSSVIFIGLFWGFAYFAVFKLQGDWMKNLMGVLILLLLIFLLDEWSRASGVIPMILMLPKMRLPDGN